MDYVPSVFCYSNKECSKKRQQSEDRYQLITQKRLEHLSKQAAAVETDSQHGNSGSEDAECDKSEGVVMKVEVGVQTDEMLRTCKYGCDVIEDNDIATKFYTGLPSWDIFMLIFNFTAPYVPRTKSKLTLQDEWLMVPMRLRLNLLIADISYRFEISNSRVTTVRGHQVLPNLVCSS